MASPVKCLLGALCSSRITRSKIDNFSALCSIRVGVARVLVPRLSALRGEQAEKVNWRTFRLTAMHRSKANNDKRKKFIKLIKSKLVGWYLTVSL